MYVGPETLMPLASALAGLVGVLLMFWRRALAITRRGFNAVGQVVARLMATR